MILLYHLNQLFLQVLIQSRLQVANPYIIFWDSYDTAMLLKVFYEFYPYLTDLGFEGAKSSAALRRLYWTKINKTANTIWEAPSENRPSQSVIRLLQQFFSAPIAQAKPNSSKFPAFRPFMAMFREFLYLAISGLQYQLGIVTFEK